MVSLSFFLPPTATAPQTSPVEVVIGETTAQDLIADIGSPLRTHYKEDERMTIHRSSSSPVGPSPMTDDEDDDGCRFKC